MSDSQAADILNDRRERRRLPVIGLWLSAAYVAGLVLFLIAQGQNPRGLANERTGRLSRRRIKPAWLPLAGARLLPAKPRDQAEQSGDPPAGERDAPERG